MEPQDVDRLKHRAEEVLRSFYGNFTVWNVTFTSFTTKDDKFAIDGAFSEDILNIKNHKFTMVLDRYGKLHDCKIT